MIRLTAQERDEIFEILPSIEKTRPGGQRGHLIERLKIGAAFGEQILEYERRLDMQFIQNGDWARLMHCLDTGIATDEMRALAVAIASGKRRRESNRPPTRKTYNKNRLIADFLLRRLGDGGNLESAKDATQEKFEINRKKVERACDTVITYDFLCFKAFLLGWGYGLDLINEDLALNKRGKSVPPPRRPAETIGDIAAFRRAVQYLTEP